jgi:hypothetical protein
MKHNLTPEQIVYVCFGLLIAMSLAYWFIMSLTEKHYKRGYTHGYNRAKWLYSQRNNGGSRRNA